MVSEQDWSGRTAYRQPQAPLSYIRAVLQPGGTSAASPFLGKCSNEKNWWIKPPVAGMTKALVAEWVVGRLGEIIGAPVCEVALVNIPATLLPCEYAPGKQLVSGTGCASRDIGGAPTEQRGTLAHREDDDNRRRHAGVFALVDWFYGEDVQWLLDAANDWTLYSHDHGWYLPPGGAEWTVEQMRATASTPRQTLGDPTGLDVTELYRLATEIEGLGDSVIADVLRVVPPEWNIPAGELDCLGWYLAERRPAVASRLRAINRTEATA